MINLDVNTRGGVVNARRLIFGGSALFVLLVGFGIYQLFS